MLLLTKEELKLYQDAINCYICGKRILKNLAKSKSYRKVKDRCHYTSKHRDTSHSICNLKLNLLNESPVAFQNGSNYDYHFIIKELLNESVGQFECLRENTEKCKTFLIPIEKEVIKIDKGGNESLGTIS